MKEQKTVAAIISVRNCADTIEQSCRKLLEYCTSLFVVDENSNDETRNQLVKLARFLPIIIYDSSRLSKEKRFEKLLEVGTNTIGYFPFTHFLFWDATIPILDYTFNKKGVKYRNLNNHSHRKDDNSSNIEKIEDSFYKNLLSRSNVLDLYIETYKPEKKVHAPKTDSLTLKLLNKFQWLFKKSSNYSSGIFKASFHRQNLYLDYPPFRYLSDKYSPISVLDVGCGLGGYLKAFEDWGATKVKGVDGFPKNDEIFCYNSYHRHNLRMPLYLNKCFDLVICVEVAEHISPEFEKNLINSIERHSKERILFSAAQLNQPGVGHINCHRLEYWITKWNELGWEVNIFDTLAVRSLSTFLWFRKNLIVLQKKELSDQKWLLDSWNDLLKKESKISNWYNQPPAIYHKPLTTGIPDFNV